MWAQTLKIPAGTQPQQEAAKPAPLPLQGTYETRWAERSTVGTGLPDFKATSPPHWGHQAMLQGPPSRARLPCALHFGSGSCVMPYVDYALCPAHVFHMSPGMQEAFQR